MHRNTGQRPSILLLGTGHWSNPGKDFINPAYDDMRSPQRQREIEACVRQLSEFAPTRIGLEVEQRDDAAMNADYRAYRDGKFELTSN